MKKTLVLAVAVAGVIWLSCAVAGERDTPEAANMQNEMADFVQYYRSVRQADQAPDDQALTPEDLLKNDLLPLSGAQTSAGSAGAPAVKQAGGTPGGTGVVSKHSETKKGSSNAYDPHNLWRGGVPLSQANTGAANQLLVAGTAPVHVVTPTVYRGQVYNSQPPGN